MNVDQGRKRSFLTRIGSSLSHLIPKLFTLSEDTTTQTHENVIEPQSKRLRQQPTSIPPEISSPLHTGTASRANLAGPSQNSTLPNRSRFDNLPSSSSTPHNVQTSQRFENFIPVVNLGGDPVAGANNSRVSLNRDSSPQSYVPSWRRLPLYRGLGGDTNFASSNAEASLDNRSTSSFSLRGLDTSSNRSRLNPAVISAMSNRTNLERSNSSSMIHPLGGRYGGTDLRRSPTDAGSTLSISTNASYRSSNVTVKPARHNQQALTNTAMLILKELESLSTDNMFSVNASASNSSSTLKSRSYAPYTSSYERFRSRLRQNRLIERSAEDKSASKVPSSNVPPVCTTAWNVSSKVGQSNSVAPLQKRICISDGSRELNSKPFSFSQPVSSDQIISNFSSSAPDDHVSPQRTEPFKFRSPASLSSGNVSTSKVIQNPVEVNKSTLSSTATKSMESNFNQTISSSNRSGVVSLIKDSSGQANSKKSLGMEEGKWICQMCFIHNKPSSAVCVHCSCPNISKDKETNSTTSFSKSSISISDSPSNDTLSRLLASNRSKWCCEVCLVYNDPKENCCVACSSPQPIKNNQAVSKSSSKENVSQKLPQDNQSCLISNQPNTLVSMSYTAPKSQNEQTSSVTFKKSNNSSDSFEKLLAANRSKWVCDVCLVSNEAKASGCAACSTPKPKSSTGVGANPLAPKENTLKNVSQDSQMKSTCDSRLVSNETNSSVSVAGSVANSNHVQIASSIGKSTNSQDTFENFLAANRLKWTCDVCCVANEPQATACAACTTPNPKASSSKEPVKSSIVAENKFGSFLSSITQSTSTDSAATVKFGMPMTTKDPEKTSDHSPFSFGTKSTESSGNVLKIFGQSGPSASNNTTLQTISKSEIPSFGLSFSTTTASNPLSKSTDLNSASLPLSSASVISSGLCAVSSLPSQATTSMFSFGSKPSTISSSTTNTTSMFPLTVTPSVPQPSTFSFGKSDGPSFASVAVSQSLPSSTSSPFSFFGNTASSLLSSDQPPSKKSFANSQSTNVFGNLSQEPNNNINKVDGEGNKSFNGFDFSKSSFPASVSPSNSVNINGFSTVSTSSVSNFPFSSSGTSAVIFKSSTPEVTARENGSSSPIPSQRLIKKAVRRVNRA